MKNALEYNRLLESVGFTRDQAETQLRIMEQVMHENVATKGDLKELRSEVQSEMHELRSELRSEMNELKTELMSRFEILEHRMTIKFGVMTTGAMATILTLSKLLAIF